MSTAPDGREIIPAGEQPAPWYRHLLPIAKFLIEERGHLPIEKPQKYGFWMTAGGFECHLTRSITEADWQAINQRFVIPENIRYHAGLIRDGVNRIDMVGNDICIGDHGVEPIENMEPTSANATPNSTPRPTSNPRDDAAPADKAPPELRLPAPNRGSRGDTCIPPLDRSDGSGRRNGWAPSRSPARARGRSSGLYGSWEVGRSCRRGP
jgi:hypothetical protein